MYRFPEKQLPLFVDFYLPFGGRLRADHRWVKLSNVIPWDAIEQKPGSTEDCRQSKRDKGNKKNEVKQKVNEAGQILQSKLILDATCALADMRHPTDISLLNEGREKLEENIDTLYEP